MYSLLFYYIVSVLLSRCEPRTNKKPKERHKSKKRTNKRTSLSARWSTSASFSCARASHIFRLRAFFAACATHTSSHRCCRCCLASSSHRFLEHTDSSYLAVNNWICFISYCICLSCWYTHAMSFHIYIVYSYIFENRSIFISSPRSGWRECVNASTSIATIAHVHIAGAAVW